MINTTHPLHHVVQRFGDYGEKLFHGSPVCGHRLLGKFEVTFCAEINHIKTPRYSPILFDDWYSLRIYLMIRRPQTDTTYRYGESPNLLTSVPLSFL